MRVDKVILHNMDKALGSRSICFCCIDSLPAGLEIRSATPRWSGRNSNESCQTANLNITHVQGAIHLEHHLAQHIAFLQALSCPLTRCAPPCLCLHSCIIFSLRAASWKRSRTGRRFRRVQESEAAEVVQMGDLGGCRGAQNAAKVPQAFR